MRPTRGTALGRGAVPGRRGAQTSVLEHTSAAVLCALAGRPGRPPAVDAAMRDPAGWQLLLADLPRGRYPGPLARWRGRVDALAARVRYGDAAVQARLRPTGRTAQLLFSLLEQARVESLGAGAFAGVRANLEALAQDSWIRARPGSVVRRTAGGSDGAAWIETFALLARVPLGAPLPPAALLGRSHGWRSWISGEQVRELEVLAALLEDPAAFAAQSLRVIAAVLGADAAAGDEPRNPLSAQPAPGESSAATASARTSRASPGSADPMTWAELPAAAPLQTREEPGKHPVRTAAPYRVFTTRFDETVSAAELRDPGTLERSRRELDRHLARLLPGVTRWAHRLQRRLLALQMRAWRFDLEEGLLDASRLSRVVTHPLEPLAYKQEGEAQFPATAVTLLVDNSGSMRGLPIATAAVCAELLGRVLERCGVASEVLGFTTRDWRGGRARAQWRTAGAPRGPGRLCELRHIVFKSAEQHWRRARPSFGLMLDDEQLKENVDGEALLWAHERLLRRPEPRRILLVISDGAPMDEATLEANEPDYLERHLRAVIDWIERDARVELAAVGIGHDVAAYYRRALTVPGVEQLGEAIVSQLIDLFEPPATSPAAVAATARRRAPAGRARPWDAR